MNIEKSLIFCKKKSITHTTALKRNSKLQKSKLFFDSLFSVLPSNRYLFPEHTINSALNYLTKFFVFFDKQF